MTITVTGTNDAPVASAEPITTDEDTPVDGQIVASDVDGDELTYTVKTEPENGTVIVSSDGSYTYTPAPDYNGSDRFVVTVADGQGGTVDVTVAVTVVLVPNPVDNDVYLVETSKSTGTVLKKGKEQEAENEKFKNFNINTVSLDKIDTLEFVATSDFNAFRLDEMEVEVGNLASYAFVVEQKVNGQWIRPDLSGSDNNFDEFGVMSLSSIPGIGTSKKLKGVTITLDLPAGEYRLALLPDQTKVSKAEKAEIKIKGFDDYESIKTVTVDEANSEMDGNFITQSLGDSADGFKVTSVIFGGKEYTLGSNEVTVEGAYGSLTIKADGSYTYESLKSVGEDNFTVSLSDGKYDMSSELNFNNVVASSVASTSFSLANVESFDMDDADADTVEPLALTLDDLISKDNNEELPFFLEFEETGAEALATTSIDNTAVDSTAALDVQPVVDPLDDLLNQNTSLI